MKEKIEELNKLLEKFAEVTYRAGLLHGQGLIGSPQHIQASQQSKELLQEIKRLISQ